MKLIKIEVQSLENAGCNNGNYPEVIFEFDNGETIEGLTCNCGAGCSNTFYSNIKNGMEFSNNREFYNFVNDHNYN